MVTLFRQRFPRILPARLLLALAVTALLLFAGTAGSAHRRALADNAPAPKAYIGLFKDNAIAVLDTGTRSLLGTIPVPAGPHGLVLTPDGRTLYVSSDGASTVSVIDTSTDTVTRSIEVGQMPHGLAITADGRTVLVAGFGTNMVSFIDTATNTVAGQVAVASPHNIAIDPSGSRAIVASQPADAPALVVIDLAGRTVSATVPLDKVPRALNFTPDGAKLFFTVAGDDAVRVLDAAMLQVVDSVPVSASPHHPLVTPDGEYLLVVSQGPGELSSIDPNGDKLLGTVKVGMNPHWIGLTPDGKTAYVTNEGSGDVSVVDIESMTVAATVPVGNGPRKIVVQQTPGGNTTTSAAAMPATAPPPAASPAAHASGPSGDASADAVQIAGFAFGPSDLTVAAGQTVTFTNNDSIAHTTTSVDGAWDSGPLQPGDSFSVTLSQPGTYAYGCTIHPFMHGSITITG